MNRDYLLFDFLKINLYLKMNCEIYHWKGFQKVALAGEVVGKFTEQVVGCLPKNSSITGGDSRRWWGWWGLSCSEKYK